MELKASLFALMAKILFTGRSCVHDREARCWYFLDAWTPDCERLIRLGLAEVHTREGREDLGELRLTARGRELLHAETARLCRATEREER